MGSDHGQPDLAWRGFAAPMDCDPLPPEEHHRHLSAGRGASPFVACFSRAGQDAAAVSAPPTAPALAAAAEPGLAAAAPPPPRTWPWSDPDAAAAAAPPRSPRRAGPAHLMRSTSIDPASLAYQPHSERDRLRRQYLASAMEVDGQGPAEAEPHAGEDALDGVEVDDAIDGRSGAAARNSVEGRAGALMARRGDNASAVGAPRVLGPVGVAVPSMLHAWTWQGPPLWSPDGHDTRALSSMSHRRRMRRCAQGSDDDHHNDDDDDDDDDGDASANDRDGMDLGAGDRGRPPSSVARVARSSSAPRQTSGRDWLAVASQMPYVMTNYLQLLFSTFVLAVVVYVVVQVIRVVHHDLALQTHKRSTELLTEIAACTKQYVLNRCDPPEARVPAMEARCGAWERCMAQDHARVGGLKVAAETVADIMNHFVEPLSLKAMLFGLLLVVSALVMPVHALRAVGIWPAFGSRATHRHAVDQPAGPASPPPPRPPALAQARRRWPPPPLPPPPPRRALEPAPPTTMRYDDGARWHPDAPARLAGSDAAARHLRGAPAYLTHSWD